VAYAIWTWQGDHWAPLNTANYTFTVGSDGTGYKSFIFGNQAGRTDVATDFYVDGVRLLVFAPLAC